MKSTIATSPSQSARIQACGVDPKTADMCYIYYDEFGEQVSAEDFHDILLNPSDGRIELIPKDFGDYDHSYSDESPAWSLSALLSLLPTSLTSELGGKYMLELSKLRMHDAWEIQWYSGQRRWTTRDKDGKFCKLWDKSPIEACVKAIEWLTKEGYKLNENE